MTKKLLSKSEPSPFRVKNAKGAGPGVITVEHASNRVPKSLQKTFGVSKKDLAEHIGWDIGAAEAALHLAKLLDMPVLLSNYSRLVVDLNRSPASPTLMPDFSDPLPGRRGIAIPGNAGLSARNRKARLDALYGPYHKALQSLVEKSLKKGVPPFLLSIHSFTPVMGKEKRPWHIGILWDDDGKTARRVIRNLEKSRKGIVVGANAPYSLKKDRLNGSAARLYGRKYRIPRLLVEFRQDLVGTKKGAHEWAALLAAALKPLLA